VKEKSHRLLFSLLVILGLAVSTRSFGSLLFFEVASAAFAATACCICVSERRLPAGLACLLLLVSGLFEPALHRLYGFHITLALIARGTLPDGATHVLQRRLLNGLISGFLAIWLIQESDIGSWVADPRVMLATFPVLVGLLAWQSDRISNVLVLGVLLWTASNLAFERTPNIEIGSNTTIAAPYRHGRVLQNYIGGSLVAPTNVKGAIGISNLFYPADNKSSRPIYLVDHDVMPSKEHPSLGTNRLIQPHPWHTRQFFGDQYLLFAVSKDNAWVSNLGGSLQSKGRLLLGSCHHKGGSYFEPIVVREKGLLYVQDSDPFVDRLVPYAKNAVCEITLPASFPRLLNMGLILVGLLPGLVSPLGMFLVLLTTYFHFTAGSLGNVRIVSVAEDPHELSRAWGVPRSLIDAGYEGIPGSQGTELLIVKPNGRTTVLPTERLVLAGSGSLISFNGRRAEVRSLPLGEVKGVVDAREVVVDGVSHGSRFSDGTITIIGTDSPAKQTWSTLRN